VSETWQQRQERLAEVERFALAEIQRRLEAGEIPARPGRYEVTVCEEVEV